MSRSILVVAGEVSGDMHLAPLLKALKQRDPELTFWGVGGEACEEAGVDTLYHVRDMAVMGLVEVLRHIRFFHRAFKHLLDEARERKPAAALLVDYPGFNLRLARRLHAMGVPVIYYVCPQVWAWHRSRIPRMARILDRLLVIFPFEVEVFEGTGLQVQFVGHPLVEAAARARTEPPADLCWGAPSRRLALLPGSRRQEIERILPVMLAAAEHLSAPAGDLSVRIAAPSDACAAMIREVMSSRGDVAADWPIVVGQTREVLRQATAALVASGTATLEAALMECPMAVVYLTSPATYWLGKRLVQVPHIGMVNLVAQREICPEFIQDEARPEALAETLSPLLLDTPLRSAMIADLQEVGRRLGEGRAAERAADSVLDLLMEKAEG